jgi:hypothetical protein
VAKAHIPPASSYNGIFVEIRSYRKYSEFGLHRDQHKEVGAYSDFVLNANLRVTRGSSYCTIKWNEALEVCRQNLNDQDEEQLDQIKTCDDLLESLSVFQTMIVHTKPTSLSQLLYDSLQPLRSFITLLAAALGSTTIQTAIIWGIMSLVIKVRQSDETPCVDGLSIVQAAGHTETLLPETLGMLKDLGHDLEIFQIYETTFAENGQMGNELMDIFVEIITFWTQAIHFLRRNKYGKSESRFSRT